MVSKTTFLNVLFLLVFSVTYAQVKISGTVRDAQQESIPFANIFFVGSSIGTVSDENGKFYLESNKTYSEIDVVSIGIACVSISVCVECEYVMSVCM